MADNNQGDEFQKYAAMRDKGASAKDAYVAAKADELQPIECIRMLTSVFGLTLVQAKEVMIVGDGLGSSIEDYEEKVITGLHNIVKLSEDEQNQQDD